MHFWKLLLHLIEHIIEAFISPSSNLLYSFCKFDYFITSPFNCPYFSCHSFSFLIFLLVFEHCHPVINLKFSLMRNFFEIFIGLYFCFLYIFKFECFSHFLPFGKYLSHSHSVTYGMQDFMFSLPSSRNDLCSVCCPGILLLTVFEFF